MIRIAGIIVAGAGCALLASAQTGPPSPAQPVPAQRAELIDLWAAERAAFGVFVPDERPREPGGRGRGGRQPAVYTAAGGEALARNSLYDFVFLNLEGGYDPEAVVAIATGLRNAGEGSPPALLVRIPPIERDGADITRGRVVEVLAAGADGVVFPHVRSPEEAALAVSFVRGAGRRPWSRADPDGDTIAMIMIEDPESLRRVAETAEVADISVLACGIGSLRGALGGDREAAEAGTLEVLEHARRVGAADMITANTSDVTARVEQGFLALLMQGPEADEAIRAGRAVAGR